MKEIEVIRILLNTKLFDVEMLRELKYKCLKLCKYELVAKIVVEERRLQHLSDVSRLERLGLNLKTNEIDNKK
jgi:hypothetical protein